MAADDQQLLVTAPEAPETEWAAAQIGRYVYRRLVGAGGMGVVVAAHDPDLDREVAIKIVATGDGDEARPIREAQAMARLSHPNVVQVYEVLRVGERTAIVMELVEGEELGSWQKRERRTWREIVDAYVGASRGLAAAHRAGIVHRDFKPSNALVDRDGVVRVTDFGLARSAAPGTQSRDDATGGIGTPAYMAPEQHRREALDARTDQWSLACALYEALYGRRPFASAEQSDLAGAVARGKIDDEPADTPVPRRVRAAIRRALSLAPDDRFATVDAFAAAISPTPRRVPYVIGAAVLVLAAAVSISMLSTQNTGPAPCEGLDGPIRAVWTDPVRANLRARLLAKDVGVPVATVDAALRALDEHAANWTATRTQACMDSQQGVRSAETLDTRMRCLDRRVSEVSGLLDGLATGDLATLRATSDAVAQLRSVVECAEAKDATERPAALRAELDAGEDAVARAGALMSLGQYERVLPLVDRATTAGELASDHSLTARALVLRGQCEDRLGRYPAAHATFHRAAKLAAQAQDHAVVADALAWAFLVEGDRLGRRADALRSRPYVELAVEAAGQPDAVRADWLHFLAILLYDDPTHVDEAANLERESLAIRQRTLPPTHVYIYDSIETLANIEAARRNYDESIRLLKQVLEARVASRGPGDVMVSAAYNNLGVVEIRRNDNLAAIEFLTRSVAIGDAAGQPNTAAIYNLALAQFELHRWRAAAQMFAVSLEVSERITGKDSRDAAEASMYVGVSLIAGGEVERGRPMLLSGVERARKSGALILPSALAHAARLALHDGDHKGARALLDEAKKLPTSHPELVAFAAAELVHAESGCAASRPLFASTFESALKNGKLQVQTLAAVALAECEIAAGDLEPAKQRLEVELASLIRATADDTAIAPVRAALAKAQSPVGRTVTSRGQ